MTLIYEISPSRGNYKWKLQICNDSLNRTYFLRFYDDVNKIGYEATIFHRYTKGRIHVYVASPCVEVPFYIANAYRTSLDNAAQHCALKLPKTPQEVPMNTENRARLLRYVAMQIIE